VVVKSLGKPRRRWKETKRISVKGMVLRMKIKPVSSKKKKKKKKKPEFVVGFVELPAL